MEFVNLAHASPISTTPEYLHGLVVLRYFVLAAVGVALAVSQIGWDMQLPLRPVGAALAVACYSLLLFWDPMGPNWRRHYDPLGPPPPPT